jgi:hypothetical protein
MTIIRRFDMLRLRHVSKGVLNILNQVRVWSGGYIVRSRCRPKVIEGFGLLVYVEQSPANSCERVEVEAGERARTAFARAFLQDLRRSVTDDKPLRASPARQNTS